MDIDVSLGESRRVRLSLEGRFILVGSSKEYACSTYEMSPTDVSLFSSLAAPPGSKVVLYLQELGRFTGPILRTTEIGFEMGLELTQQKSDKLAVQLAWREELAKGKVKDRRTRERIVPLTDITILRLRSKECVARIRCFTTATVEIETEQFLSVGAEVVVGNTPARVSNLVRNGVVCEFHRPFEAGEINETTRL